MIDFRKIPPKIGYYLAGFADGEGSFMIVFRRRRDYRIPWKVSLAFNVSNRDKVILALFKRYLQCGTLRQRADGVWYYEVNNLRALQENVVPFFERYRFLSAKKKRDFSLFKRALALVAAGEHTAPQGIEKILALRRRMNAGGKRKHRDEEILASLRGGSSEAIRQAPHGYDPGTGMRRRPVGEEMVQPPGQPGAPKGDKPKQAKETERS